VLTSAPGDEPLTGSDLLGRPLSAEESKKMRHACDALRCAAPLALRFALCSLTWHRAMRVRSAFWEENIRAVISLFRAELAHVEAGTYKLPYDLSPLGGSDWSAGLAGLALAPQWNPLAVAATAAAYMRDQADVQRRRSAKAGQEMREGFSADPARYPKYYLQVRSTNSSNSFSFSYSSY
jgi:hypothetical protein